jgi:3'-phosphoadenosine 5'-phosphosulfate sulfotransferase (PAPS reductase)/FAD synthetase
VRAFNNSIPPGIEPVKPQPLQGMFDFSPDAASRGFVAAEPDPLDPDWEVPTPLDLVMRLNRRQRERRVERLGEMAWARYAETLNVLGAGKEIVATCGLFTGGKDSTVLAHLFRPALTHLVHANTETGLEAAREHVRATAHGWDLPLIEERPATGQGYWDMVLGTIRTKDGTRQPYPGGFPGPAMHQFMYIRLKERALERAKHRLGVVGSRTKRAIYLAGRRRAESKRREDVPHYEPWGSAIWCSPLAVWHKADLLTYRLMHADTIPISPVADQLGMSGECGCGSNAHPGERERWFAEFPDDPFLQRVLEVEALLAPRTDIPEHRKKWGWGATYDAKEDPTGGRLCGKACGPDPLLDLMDPLIALEATA